MSVPFNVLTEFEVMDALKTRANQIKNGSDYFLDEGTKVPVECIEIAILEFIQKNSPVIITRDYGTFIVKIPCKTAKYDETFLKKS